MRCPKIAVIKPGLPLPTVSCRKRPIIARAMRVDCLSASDEANTQRLNGRDLTMAKHECLRIVRPARIPCPSWYPDDCSPECSGVHPGIVEDQSFGKSLACLSVSNVTPACL